MFLYKEKKKNQNTHNPKLSLTLKPPHGTIHNGSSTLFLQYYYLKFLELIRDLLINAIFKSEHEVAEVTAKLDSYTLNKSKHFSSE